MEGLADIFVLLPWYLIILVRTFGMMFSAPVFNSRNIPLFLRISLSLLLR